MLSTVITEQAMRAAVNVSARLIASDTESILSSLKNTAIDRMTNLVQANCAASSIPTQLVTQSNIIGIAIDILSTGYRLICDQMNTLRHQRLSFDKERLAGIATFVISENIEEARLSLEERVIKGYLDAAKKQITQKSQKDYLYHYMGIHESVLNEEHRVSYYSVLPFYRMSDSLALPLASPNAIDIARTNISLFFKSFLAQLLQEMNTDFQTDSFVPSLFIATVQRKNYLNDRRACRFILMTLANLLWNLQHPVDMQSGFAFSLAESIELCTQAELFLNLLLDKKKLPFIHKIKNMDHALVSFIHKVEFHVKALREAYIYEQLHELNLVDINSTAHRALRLIDKSILNLTFHVFNPISKNYEPDEFAADNIAYTFGYLHLLLSRNKDNSILRLFDSFRHVVSYSFSLNPQATTVIDVLIIFCHMTAQDRQKLLQQFDSLAVDSAKEFITTLMLFYKKYVKQMKHLCEQELKQTFFSNNEVEIAERTARRIIPITTLVLADYRVDLNNTKSIKNDSIITGNDQIDAINAQAKAKGGYYYWSLSSILQLSGTLVESIDQLPIYQDRMTKITLLIDNLVSLMNQYHHYLQLAPFQRFLIKCFTRIKEEYLLLAQQVQRLNVFLGDDEKISRELNGVLRPMIDTLDQSINNITLTIDCCFTVLNKPDFIERQRQLLLQKLELINGQYLSLFGTDAEVSFITQEIKTQNSIRPLALPDETHAIAVSTGSFPVIEQHEVTTEQFHAFKLMAKKCYAEMSLLSQCSKKGADLLLFLSRLDEIHELSLKEYKQQFFELIRIVAAYRPMGFFSAAYADTRSAKPIIDALCDPDFSKMLPPASMIFDLKERALTLLDKDKVLQCMQQLQNTQNWSLSY